MRKFITALMLVLWAVSASAQGVVPRPSAGSAEVAFGSTTGSGTITANDQSATVALSGYGAASVVITGTWVGTITFEVSVDGSTWATVEALPSSSSTAVTSTTANGSWSASVGGFHSFRVRSTAWTSGTATVALRASLTEARKPAGELTVNDVGVTSFPDNEPINIAQVAGAAPSATNPFFVQLTDGTTAQTTHTGDADTGAGTVTRVFTGLFGTASGGPSLISATGTSLDVNVTTATLAATQSGTWTVQPGNTANTTAWLVAADGLGGTADAAATAGSTGSVNAKLRLLTTTIADLLSSAEISEGHLLDIKTQMADEATVAANVIDTGPQTMAEAKDFDGSALPNTVTEGQAVRFTASLSGIPFSFLTNEDGTKELGKREDDAHTTLDYGVPVWARRIDTLAASSGTSGDYETFNTTARGALWTQGDGCGDPSAVTTVAISTSTSGNNELVALTTNEIIYVCGFNFMAAGTVDVQFIYGTGSACALGETDITGAYPLIAQTGLNVANAGSVQFKGAVSNAVCIELSASVQVSGLLTYVKR